MSVPYRHIIEGHGDTRFSDNPERQRILKRALNARTSAEVAVATQELDGWVQRNPQDLGIVDAYEALSLRQDIAAEKASEALATPSSHAA